ncbi:MAG: hypothetical protein XD78_1902 [Desulfotomaculum sp. 46_296]|nr:MAG: hypothetical protein XD78_1902 [Desulfotomaculum sp. 46_296]
MTFNELTKIEPRLEQLYQEARQIDGSGKHFCANHIWYEEFKPRLLSMVGTGAARAELRTVEAYNCAYRRIYEALPDCGDPGRIWVLPGRCRIAGLARPGYPLNINVKKWLTM